MSQFVQNISPTRPAVSWLLCSHVTNEHLQLSIKTCLDQTFSDFELLVIANGPNSEIVAASVLAWHGTDCRVRVFSTPVCQLSFSLSLGLHFARAPLIARMDSDDLNHLHRLQKQVDFMNAHKDVAVLGTAFEIVDKNGKVLRSVSVPTNDKLIRRALFHGNPLCHPTVMFRRDVVLAAGGYLGGLHAEDYDLWSRLALNSKLHFANLSDVCLGYRVIGVGAARHSRWAYASMAASQLRNFLIGAGLLWGVSAFLSVIKLLIRSDSLHHSN